MRGLSHKNLEQIASALLELHAHQDFLTLPQHFINVTRKLMPVDITTYNEVDLGNKELRAVHDLGGNPEKYFPAFVAHQHEYPPLQHFIGTGDTTPLMGTDFSSRRQFEQTALFNEFYKVFGIREHLAMYFPLMANFQAGMILFRFKTVFTENERAILKLLGPHLCLAWRNTRMLAQAQLSPPASSTTAAWRISAARVTLDGDWRVRVCAEETTRWLKWHFRILVIPGLRLPDLLISWLKRITAPSGHSPNGLGKALASRRGDEHLEINWVPESPLVSYLNIIYRTRVDSYAAASELGLTTRESQVIRWLLEGKTNPEIGKILTISPNTVRKHLERIYAKIGVENRMAAMRKIRDF